MLLLFDIDSLFKSKKIVPGVGTYKIHETDKQLSKPVTSLQIRRH